MVSRLFAAVLLVALLVALFGNVSVQAQRGPVQADGERAAQVRVQLAGELFVFPRRQASAAVLAKNESQISAQVSALILQVSADTGDTVAAGDVLVRLDDADARLGLAQAKASRDGLSARLRLAQRQLKRLRELKTNNFVSTEAVNQRDAEVVSLRAQLKASAAQVAIAQRQLAKCVINAPFDAAVAERHAQVGELTSPGAPLFTLTQLGGEQVSATIALADASHLVDDANYAFQTAGVEHPVSLKRVSPVVSKRTRTREARFSFTNEALAAGTQGRILWADKRTHLPPEVLVRRDGRIGVFLVRKQKAVFVPIDGAQEGRPALVRFAADMPVVVQGQVRLRAGQSVAFSGSGQ